MQLLGCETEVLCLDDPGAAFLGKDPFVIHALGLGTGPLCYHHSLRLWLEGNLPSYDAIIVHGLWLWPSTAVRIVIQRLRRKVRQHSALSPGSQLPSPNIPPYFVMPHGMLDPWFQRAPGRGWKALRNLLYWHLAEHRVINDAEAILFTCSREMELARTSFHRYKPKKEIDVGYGVPPPPYPSESMKESVRARIPKLPSSQPYLLFLGRIHPKKGVDLLIRAYLEIFGNRSKAKSEKLDGSDNPTDAKCLVPALVIAGPIDSDYARDMIDLAKRLLPGSVFLPHTSSDHSITDYSLPMNRPAIHFTGMLSGDEKWGALYGCEAFVLPSHQENFAIAVAEALSCGRPVLISDQVNIAPEIEAVGAGLVGIDDQQGTSLLLRRWMKLHSHERIAMSRSASAGFLKKFGVASAAERHMAALRTAFPNAC